jgi:hypothetical protein
MRTLSLDLRERILFSYDKKEGTREEIACRGGREPSNAAAGVFVGCLDFVSGEIASDIFERFIGLGCAASRRPIGVCHIAIGIDY